LKTGFRTVLLVCLSLCLCVANGAIDPPKKKQNFGAFKAAHAATFKAAHAANVQAPAVPVDESLVTQYITQALGHPDPNSVLLTASLRARLKQFDPNWETSDELKQKAMHSLFSVESYEALADVVSAIQRSEYNNSVVLGDAGVGKTHLTDALVAMLSFGLLPEELKQKIGYNADPSTPRGKTFQLILGNTDVVLVNNTVLTLSNTESKQPWSDTDTRMKVTLAELFTAAKQEYARQDENGKKVGRRTVFIFEEIATLPPLVNDSLKTLEDSTGFHDPDRTELLKADPGYSVLAFTTPDEWRKMVGGDSAIERRYKKTQIYQPPEEKTFEIVRKKANQEWESQHGMLIDDQAIRFLIANRKFLTSPPLAMPASVLAATNDLFIWKTMNPGGDPDVISTQDAQTFLMDKVGITDIWFEGPNGEPPFHDFEKEVQARVIGHDEQIRAIGQIIKTWAKFGMGGEPPLIILGGPSGSGKDTIVAAINQVLFGHDGKKLNFSLAGAKGFGVDAFLEGPPIGNHSDHSIGVLAEALDKQKMGIVALNEGYDLPSGEYEKFKVMIEAGEIRPKGNDSRARPLLFPMFLMGQWGEDLFEGKTDAEIEAIQNGMNQDQVEALFLKGKKNGLEGALPYALLQRAKKSGGVFLIRPVPKADYGKIVELNVPSVVERAKKSRSNVEASIDPSVVKFTAAFSKATSASTRGLGANFTDFTLGALSEANDRGLKLQDAKVSIRHERDPNPVVDNIVVDWLNPPDQKPMSFRLPAKDLYRHGARCAQTFIDLAKDSEPSANPVN